MAARADRIRKRARAVGYAQQVLFRANAGQPGGNAGLCDRWIGCADFVKNYAIRRAAKYFLPMDAADECPAASRRVFVNHR